MRQIRSSSNFVKEAVHRGDAIGHRQKGGAVALRPSPGGCGLRWPRRRRVDRSRSVRRFERRARRRSSERSKRPRSITCRPASSTGSTVPSTRATRTRSAATVRRSSASGEASSGSTRSSQDVAQAGNQGHGPRTLRRHYSGATATSARGAAAARRPAAGDKRENEEPVGEEGERPGGRGALQDVDLDSDSADPMMIGVPRVAAPASAPTAAVATARMRAMRRALGDHGQRERELDLAQST